jgi:uncharacterized phage protein (TIGR02216 family)
MTEKFPWAELMHLGLGTLQLSPAEFWRSSPRELMAACGSPPAPHTAKLLRQNLNDMMKRYPD